tara:strand:- start:1661 stop:1981 length:321 start_codon:yes stop_codon:yes gene_type:complete
MSESQEEGQLQDYSVDQLAGAVVLVLGAIAGLLQVIWMSKCHCKVNLCYIFRCERRPPTEEEMKTLKTKAGELKDKKKSGTPADSGAKEPEPEPEPQSTSLVPTRP